MEHHREHSQNHTYDTQHAASVAPEIVRSLDRMRETLDDVHFLRTSTAAVDMAALSSLAQNKQNDRLDNAVQEFYRTLQIQNAQLHKLDSEVLLSQIAIADAAVTNKLTVNQMETLNKEFRTEQDIL